AGSDSATAFAHQRDRRQRVLDDFPEHLAELLAYFGHQAADGEGAGTAGGCPLPRYTALPGGPNAPEPWLLGSSPQSAVWAAELGLPYAFADFINPDGAAAAAHYRTDFRPSAVLGEPRVAVAAWAICADTDAEARELSASF